MISEEELANLTGNVIGLVVASVPMAMTLAFSSFGEKMAGIVDDICNATESNQAELDKNIAYFQDEVAADILGEVWPQLEQGKATMAQDGTAKIVMSDVAFQEGPALLEELQKYTPDHLPPLTQSLTKEQFSQYMLLLVSESPASGGILKLQEWLSSMDPKQKA